MALIGQPPLAIRGLKVSYSTEWGEVRAVDDVNLLVDSGQIVGLVGESGSGKSTLALSVLNLLPSEGRIVAGGIIFNGVDLAAAPEDELRKIRGRQISMIFQHPIRSLDPSYRVGDLIAETIMAHQDITKSEARRRTQEMLRRVGLSNPDKMMYRYPHQLSGGMAQRIMFAIAMSSHPSVLIADEPTSDLDVTTQAQILRLLKTLNEKEKVSILLITHNLGIVAELCDRVYVMRAGRVMESGERDGNIREPKESLHS